MAVATHIKQTRPALSEGPIDWRMDIELHGHPGNGHSPEGDTGRNSNGRLRFALRRPGGVTERPSTEALLLRELIEHVIELRKRVECLENRLPPHHVGSACDADVETESTRELRDDMDEAAGAHEPGTAREDNGSCLADLPRGPLSIDVVAAALGKTARTIRGWCQIGKYCLPCHKEGGRWHCYRDELLAWHPEYERQSRRDAKSAQAKRRRTKNGR